LYNRLWEIIDIQYDSVLVILDEIDKLNGRDGTDDTNVLFQLSRSKESNKTETKLGVVCISNDIHYSEDFGAAVHSSYEPEKIVFSAYDATELRNILHKRADAFKPGVLNDEVLPLSAALAAQEHGDARRAITILRKAGRLASRQDDPRVTTHHVHAAADYADADRVQELLRGTPIQPKLTILALAALCTQSDSQVHTSPTIYRMYLNLIQMVDANRLSQRRVTDFLKEHRDNGLLELERTGGGPGEGSYYECHLTEKEDIVFETLLEDDRLSELEQAEIAKVAFQIDL
jgi:cell division control protein 6